VWQGGGFAEIAMTDRRRTKTEELNYAELMRKLSELESWTMERKLKERMPPPEWRSLERDTPTTPHKTRVTIGFDDDMLRWYRGLGAGYQARMNAVLRTYMHAAIAKEIVLRRDKGWDRDIA
jgi:uncharacterized protein (DUF4415 family)